MKIAAMASQPTLHPPGSRLALPLFVAAMLNAAFIVGLIAIYASDPSALICADRDKIGRPPFEAVHVGFPSEGFDGQYYFVIARSPFSKHEANIDLPAYRHSRIVYPVLGWLLSGGDSRLLLYALPFINWLALVGVTWLGAITARHFGRSTWWGLALPLMVNAIPPALRDLTDPIATLTACSVVTAWLLRWPAWMFLPLCLLAILSREQNLLVVGVVLLESVLHRHWRVVLSAALSVPLWLGWVGLLHSIYGQLPFFASNTSGPLAGIRFRLRNMSGPLGSPDSRVHALAMLTLLTQIACTLRLFVGRPTRLVFLIALAGLGLAIMGSELIYFNLESYTRVFWWMPFALWLWAIQTGRTWPGYLALFGLIWPAYSLAQAWYKVYQGGVTFI